MKIFYIVYFLTKSCSGFDLGITLNVTINRSFNVLLQAFYHGITGTES